MILILIGIIFIICGGIISHKVYLEQKKIKDKTIQDWRNELKNELQKDINTIEESTSQINILKRQIENEKLRLKEAKEATEQILNSEQEKVQLELQGVRAIEEEKLQHEFEMKKYQSDLKFTQLLNDMQQAADQFEQEKRDNKIIIMRQYQDELSLIKKELEEYRTKRAMINEQIRKEEELKNEQDFHRIILSNDAKSDIEYLISIENKIKNKEILHKLIWTEYIQRPFNQMLKNVLGDNNPKNVIYCIQNIDNNKKYIGKTQGEVSKRWTEHIKSSLGIGTISHQLVHEAFFNNWDRFVFSILEEVKGDKLSEREKYYIEFFQSDRYGYNNKKGG